MFKTFDITIDAQALKEKPLLPDVLHILKHVRPDWQQENIRSKVSIDTCLMCDFNVYSAHLLVHRPLSFKMITHLRVVFIVHICPTLSVSEA